ncbi:alpha/beta hydrolase [Cypionkella sp.]|uniref:alpha/beta hydrolase n=1 Tax=Cypionkella sp. TaxID=2811411 RepID=UPI002728F5C9|nr:alpha/beta fold hydrolase [Cypionkella sp.]MDO8984387.1 alpha/beta fold hydrolase [Cypionkella sp.]MDP2048134.1 alpha/beta fold hydrolase [Cypionkella sp.]
MQAVTMTKSEPPFQTQPWSASGGLESRSYSVHRIGFESYGSMLAGNLFLPKSSGPWPAIVIVGPVAFVKEQAPLQYATRLAAEGFVVLIFDPRCHGESEGLPRRNENPTAKVADICAAVDALVARPDVDRQRIFVLGICQGVNWTIEAARKDLRIRAICLVAGHYLTPQVARMYLGGEEAVAARLAKSLRAAETNRQTGEVGYVPIVSSSFLTPDRDALLAASFVQSFYIRWADRHPMLAHRGLWENRITEMSEHLIWGHRIDQSVQDLQLPVLMLHADRAASGPDVPRQLFEAIPSSHKKLVWLGTQGQIQFYEDPITIDVVIPHLSDFLTNLPPETENRPDP